MPTSISGHLATQPNSTSLDSLATLADQALVSESNGKVAEINVTENAALNDLPINVCIKMENPGSFTLNYAATFFLPANNITYSMSIYLYTH